MKQSLVLALALLLLAAASVAGCAGEPTPNVLRNAPRATGQTEASGEPGETTPAATAVPIPPAPSTQEVTVNMGPTIPTPSSPGLQKLVMQAKEDLARRLDKDVDEIDLVELQAVVWPDGGLGCPEPGMLYTQVPVEGVLIRLHAGTRIYSYHSGAGTPPFLCERTITEHTP